MELHHLAVPTDIKNMRIKIKDVIKELEAKGPLTIESIAVTIVFREEKINREINEVILKNNNLLISEIDKINRKLK